MALCILVRPDNEKVAYSQRYQTGTLPGHCFTLTALLLPEKYWRYYNLLRDQVERLAKLISQTKPKGPNRVDL